MADLLPPIPYDRPQTSFEWIDWYTKLNLLINSGAQHNSLQGLQGGTSGQYYHLTSTQYTQLTGGGETELHTHPNTGSQLPVGTYYFSDNNTNPATTLGYGTWVLQSFTPVIATASLP